MRAPWTLAVSLGIAVAGVTALLGARPGSAGPGDTKIAVVDVLTVINDSPQKKVIEDKQADRASAAKTYAQAEDARLKGLRAELEQLARTHPSRREKEDAFVRAKAAFEAEMKIKEARALDDYTTDLENLYKDVQAVTGQVAREQGYQIVLFKTQDPFNLRSPSSAEFAMGVGLRTVVWHDPSVDITAAVTARLRTIPTRPGGGPPPGPSPAPAPGPSPLPAPPPPGPVPAPAMGDPAMKPG